MPDIIVYEYMSEKHTPKSPLKRGLEEVAVR